MSSLAAAFSRRGVPELAADVAAGRERAETLLRRALDRLDEVEPAIGAFLAVDAEGALARAREVDGGGGSAGDRPAPAGARPALAANRPALAANRLALAGIPVALKDNLCTAHLPTTCGSLMLEGFTAPYDATVVRRLVEAGALVVGKTNMDEFAMGSSTETSAFGPTRNPHDRARVPGGSSGGSAAAVAAGVVPAALGSDTGGSVRQPAALCGVVGIKPSYGRVSRYGLVAYASSLDQVGTFGARVADAAALLEVIAGADPFDAMTASEPMPPLLPELDASVEGLVVGVPKEYYPDELDPRVARLCREAIERLRGAGARVTEVSLPHTRYAIATYYVLAPAEASSNLARFDGVRYGRRAPSSSALDLYEESRSRGFGAEVKRRIMLGTFALSSGHHEEYYGRAQRMRARIGRDFRRAFEEVDVLLTPTAPAPAFGIGEKTDRPYEMYRADVFTVPVNLAALPALSLPVGAADGLPVGAQIVAPRWGEPVMVRVAAALERINEQEGAWTSRR